jgi:hypothetical protein
MKYVIIFAVFFLVFFGAGAFYLYGPLKTEKEIANPFPVKQIAQNPVSPTPEAKVPSDWQTYTNKELGFSFKYPSETNWMIKETKTGITPHIYNLPTLYNYNVDKAAGRGYSPELDGDIFKIEFRISDEAKGNPETYLTEQRKNGTGMDGNPLQFNNVKQMMVGGKNAVYYEVNTATGIFCPIVAIEYPDNRLLHLNPGLSCEKFQKTFQQILASFTFTSEKTDPATITEAEKAKIDAWITKNNFNQYGDPKDMMYAGGTPLFDELSGQTVDKYLYILKNHPDRPWNK